MNFLTVKLMGGLGNYMFQIAATYSKSLDLGFDFFVDYSEAHVGHKNPLNYSDNFFKNIKTGNTKKIYRTYNEPFFSYKKIPNFIESVKLHGYFQSEKYFIDHKKEIGDLFVIPKEKSEFLLKKYSLILNGNTCSIHVRRGDYVNLQSYHPLQTLDYYKKSYSEIGEDKTFFIFSDDIKWCENNLYFIKNKIYCKDNEDYEDLYLMSMCENNIIANSSFSWWGAWLNQDKKNKIIAPKNWFGPSNSHLGTKDIYLYNWIII